MAKNLIPEICKMLGVELGEEFKIKGYRLTYMITDDKWLIATDDSPETGWSPANTLFVDLLNGDAEIVKIPWKPKKGEKYWGFWYSQLNDAWLVSLYTWSNNPDDFAFYKAGWVFRSKKEAKAALPAVAKEIGVRYEL